MQHLGNKRKVGEREAKVSGGEKQRIAIARIFLKNPQICIFDEFTSSLDHATEDKVLIIVKELFKHKTKIIIAHKPSAIAIADKVLYLKKGQIIQ
jgi:ABC-type multidrug transport system fused ATPase/permease subunit